MIEQPTLWQWFGVGLQFVGLYFLAYGLYLLGDHVLDLFFGEDDDT